MQTYYPSAFAKTLLAAATLFTYACRSSPEQSAATSPLELPTEQASTAHPTTLQPHNPTTDLQANLAHLNHLYDTIALPDGGTGGIVWIYCEAPDYTLLDDDDEGYTCVDDMARALVAYGMHHELRGDSLSRAHVNQLARTILHLQADNGYFYNFLWPDNTINRTFKTSVAVPDWWTWRALWALEYALAQKLLDENVAASAKTACGRVVANVRRDFQLGPDIRDTVIANLRLPNDLPAGGGADQTAVLLLGLDLHATRTSDDAVREQLLGFAERLMAMQTPAGRSLSWYNHWHAWGNSQAYALQVVGERLSRPAIAAAGRREVDAFLPVFLSEGRIASGVVTSRAITPHLPTRLPQYMVWRIDTFPQIAYGRRPNVWAAREAYAQTGDTTFRNRAHLAAAWFAGDNAAGVPMYDPATGRGYDGIVSPTKVNYNAGAESTIEALLSLLALEALVK